MTSEVLAFAVAAVVLGCLALTLVVSRRSRDKQAADRRRRGLLANSGVAQASASDRPKTEPNEPQRVAEATAEIADAPDVGSTTDGEVSDDTDAGGEETSTVADGGEAAALVARFEGELEAAFDSFLAGSGSLDEIETVVSRYESVLGLAALQGEAAGPKPAAVAVDRKGLTEALEWTRLWIAGQKKVS